MTNTNIRHILGSKSGVFYKTTLLSAFKHLTKFIDMYVFTSQELSKAIAQYLSIPSTKIQIIPNSIDLDSIRILKNKKLTPNENKYFVKKEFKIFSVGRLDNQKDFKTIIDAFSKVSPKIPNAKIFILGDGPHKESLKKYSEELNLSKKIHFLGWKKNIYKYLKHADLFVFSSKYEGFAMVIIEAMSLGVPVIATDTHFGPSEILDRGKFGYLIPVGNTKTMAEKIIELYKKRLKRKEFAKLGLKRAAEYNVREMLNSYSRLFLGLLNN